MSSSTLTDDPKNHTQDEPEIHFGSPSSSFQSSPSFDETGPDEMATASRKHSRDETDDEHKLQQHAADLVKDKASQDAPIKISDSQTNDEATEMPRTFKASQSMMPPPPKPAEISQPQDQQPPRSGQGSQRARDAQLDSASTQAKPSQIEDTTSETTIPDEENEPPSPTPSEEPQDRISDFDWADLQARYHHKMEELHHRELEIFEEFGQLCDVCRGPYACLTSADSI